MSKHGSHLLAWDCNVVCLVYDCKRTTCLTSKKEASTPKTAVVLNSTNTDEVHQYCKESCEDVCKPCSELVKTCTDDENDCGLEEDPTFGGVCPPHAVCVPKNQHCKSIFGILRN